MAAGVSIRVETKRARAALRRFGATLDDKALLNAIGLRQLKWIDDNFRSDGALSGGWKSLSSNTVAGRRRGSAKPLQDTGRLKQSFVHEVSRRQVSVGTNVQYAEFHEEGTSPTVIVVKRAKALRFVTTEGVQFRRSVRHPGVPKRKMLPTPRQATQISLALLRGIVARSAARFNRAR